MSPEKPLLVVLGATGNQGGSVISHFLSLSPPPYKIRGVTRNPASPKSAALASLGVEMVAGDFEDPASLDAAFKGASVIFSVTDFWQAFFDPSQREKAAAAGQNIGLFCRERETRLNRNIIDAVTKVETLERFVYSGLPNTGKVSGGKYPHVYHFEGKGIAEEYGKATYPKFWTEKTSVLYAGLYLENYFGPSAIFFRPILV
jgi:nucleoside-diphosphate-sugar epimerase